MNKVVMIGCVVFSSIGASFFTATADEIYLTNKDKISGVIMSEDEAEITIETEALGLVSIQKQYVDSLMREGDHLAPPSVAVIPEPEPALAAWTREISLGYNESRGNTETSQMTVAAKVKRLTDTTDLTLKGDLNYSSANKQMDSQKWSSSARYAIDLVKDKWFHFYKVEADHDRFANIDYRFTPTAGLGYWFSKTDDWKFMTEGSLGLEHTTYRDMTADTDEFVSVGRCYAEIRLFKEACLSEDISIYPIVSNSGEFRLHSETALTNPLSEALAMKVALIDDYNSTAPADKDKNDIQIISSLAYSF